MPECDKHIILPWYRGAKQPYRAKSPAPEYKTRVGPGGIVVEDLTHSYNKIEGSKPTTGTSWGKGKLT
jgi:hypothetical protein